MMKRIAVGIYFVMALLAESGLAPLLPSGISSILAPQAQARVVRRRVFVRRPNGVSRGVGGRGVRVVRRGNAAAVNQGQGRVVVRNNGANNNIQDIAGFSSLAQQGNNLLEKDQVNPFIFRRLFIDPNTGSLIGATRGETVRQLREFYLANFDKFQGNARNLVQNFLVANGAANAINGNLKVDLASGVAPKYKNMAGRDGDVSLSALNFLLNSISQTSRRLRVGKNNVGPDGITANLNLNGVMRKAALALLTNDNPYACGRNVAPRVDFLIQKALDPTTYNQLLEINTLQEEARKAGVQDDKKRSQGNKIVIAAPPGSPKESIVGIAPERTLEVQSQQNRPGLDWFISWDTFGNASPGVQTESRNPFVKGINFTNDASEAIWGKSNGFLQFGLFDAAGKAQTQAPANVALATGFGKDNLGESVQSPVNCLVCHANGFLGGGISKATQKPYTDNLNRIPSFHRQFFTNNANYRARAQRASAVFLQAMRQTGSFVPSDGNANEAASLLPDFVNEYRKPLDFTQAAKELGTTKEALSALFGKADGKFERQAFERSYCSILSRVGGGSALNNGGVRNGLDPVNSFRPRQSHDPVSGLPTRRRF